MTTPSTLSDSWSAVARSYQKHIVPGFKPAAEALCRYAGIRKGERVLDIACGPGTASFAAAALGAEVTGVDAAKGMIELARELAGAKPGITFLEGDLQRLPMPDASFDVVVSSFGVIFSSAPRHAVAEMARVLVPGGRMAFLAWPKSGAIGRYYEVLDRHIPPPNDFDPYRWADLNQVRRWLGDSFGPVSSTTVDLPFTAKSPEAAWEVLTSSMGRVALVYPAMAPPARGELDQAMVGFFRGYRKADGSIEWPRKALMIRATKLGEPARDDTKSRGIVAVLAGYLCLAVTTLLTDGAVNLALGGDTGGPTVHLIVTLVLAGGAAGLGGWLTARLAPNKPWHHVGALAALLVILTPLSASGGGAPGWYRWALAGVGILGVFVGGIIKEGVPKGIGLPRTRDERREK